MSPITRKAYAIVFIVVIIIAALGIGIYWYTRPAAEEEEPIKIGFVGPLSGALAREAIDMLRGARMAAEWVEDNWGGILGRPIEIIPEDSAYEAEKGVAAAEKLVTKDGVVGFAGFFGSGVVLATMPRVLDKYEVPAVLVGPWADDITAMHDKWVFRICPCVSYQLVAWADFVEYSCEQIGVTGRKPKVAVVCSNREYSVGFHDGLIDELEERGTVEIVYETIYPVGQTDFTSILTEVKLAEPDFLYGESEGMTFYKQFYELGLSEIMLVAKPMAAPYGTPEWWDFLGDAGDYVISSISYHEDAVFGDLTAWFTEEFTEEYGVPPVYIAYINFDAVLVLADAINRAGTTDADAIVTALEQTDLDVTLGSVNFFMEDDPAWLWHQWKPPLFWEQYQNRELELIYPEDVAATTPKLYP